MKKVKEKFFPDRIATADLGRDRVFFLGRDPLSVAIGFFIWVATHGRSRPEFSRLIGLNCSSKI